MMQDYLIRALEDDVDSLKLINVIRVITGKSIIHKGVEGEEHYKSVKKRASQIQNIELDYDHNEDNEEVEIDEILSSYLKKD